MELRVCSVTIRIDISVAPKPCNQLGTSRVPRICQCRPVSVTASVAVVGVLSRERLAIGRPKSTGRSPAEEFSRLRVAEVLRLLTDTELPLSKIAQRCCFKHPEYLSVVVKRETGRTPGMIGNPPSKHHWDKFLITLWEN